ncbi:hypothetical protein M407DRAFT_241039 [Tulasnella calospora MUT 4182]|uniref:Uncharacterized protein n=1 Tax=Tulasnella calospora MUT 4182 TaxID=1051891 RepID=A0A0C3QWV3_9AGAM|nr:hypothetical protein M407DRAFT_241039 [Tulasnella calospora MUT 4182]
MAGWNVFGKSDRTSPTHRMSTTSSLNGPLARQRERHGNGDSSLPYLRRLRSNQSLRDRKLPSSSFKGV